MTFVWPTSWETFYGPPPLGDKMNDWTLLAAAGGQPVLLGKEVLEVGPGFGIDALMLAYQTKRYVTLDTSHGVIADMQRWKRIMRSEPLEPLHASILDVPLPTSSLDVVIDFSSIDNVEGDPRAAWAEVARLVRPGGLFITTFANESVLGPSGESINNEHHVDPGWLVGHLVKYFDVTFVQGENQPRAGLVFIRRDQSWP